MEADVGALSGLLHPAADQKHQLSFLQRPRSITRDKCCTFILEIMTATPCVIDEDGTNPMSKTSYLKWPCIALRP